MYIIRQGIHVFAVELNNERYADYLKPLSEAGSRCRTIRSRAPLVPQRIQKRECRDDDSDNVQRVVARPVIK